jgi:hypothetical protein
MCSRERGGRRRGTVNNLSCSQVLGYLGLAGTDSLSPSPDSPHVLVRPEVKSKIQQVIVNDITWSAAGVARR